MIYDIVRLPCIIQNAINIIEEEEERYTGVRLVFLCSYYFGRGTKCFVHDIYGTLMDQVISSMNALLTPSSKIKVHFPVTRIRVKGHGIYSAPPTHGQKLHE